MITLSRLLGLMTLLIVALTVYHVGVARLWTADAAGFAASRNGPDLDSIPEAFRASP